MEPHISAGDVVVVREQDSYQVGDVIAYRSEMAGAVVLHRVVATLSDGYLLQGDNNSFVDSDRPSRTEVLGRKVLVVPRGERLVEVMSAPWTLILLSAGVFATWFGKSDHRVRSRRIARRRAGSFG
jgi:signal peptidase I